MITVKLLSLSPKMMPGRIHAPPGVRTCQNQFTCEFDVNTVSDISIAIFQFIDELELFGSCLPTERMIQMLGPSGLFPGTIPAAPHNSRGTPTRPKGLVQSHLRGRSFKVGDPQVTIDSLLSYGHP